jgi:hypothetical protein
MKSLSRTENAFLGFCLAFNGWYLYGYNQAIYNGDFPAIGEIALGNLSAGIFYISLLLIIKQARRDTPHLLTITKNNITTYHN